MTIPRPLELWKDAVPFLGRARHLDYCVSHARRGLALEFGVRDGDTIQVLARHSRKVVGFDSFDGLPERWDKGTADDFPIGYGAVEMPKVPQNVTLVKGLFADTLPAWLARNEKPIGFVHLDADLYSSTLEVLTRLDPFLRPGCVLAFDEIHPFFGEALYPKWREHEWRALVEWSAQSDKRFKALARTFDEQASIIIV